MLMSTEFTCDLIKIFFSLLEKLQNSYWNIVRSQSFEQISFLKLPNHLSLLTMPFAFSLVLHCGSPSPFPFLCKLVDKTRWSYLLCCHGCKHLSNLLGIRGILVAQLDKACVM